MKGKRSEEEACGSLQRTFNEQEKCVGPEETHRLDPETIRRPLALLLSRPPSLPPSLSVGLRDLWLVAF